MSSHDDIHEKIIRRLCDDLSRVLEFWEEQYAKELDLLDSEASYAAPFNAFAHLMSNRLSFIADGDDELCIREVNSFAKHLIKNFIPVYCEKTRERMKKDEKANG